MVKQAKSGATTGKAAALRDRARSGASAIAGKIRRKPRPDVAELRGPSPDPHTNLMITEVALIGGSMLVKQAVERALLGKNYSPRKAKAILKGRSLKETMLHGAVAKVATSSIPGAILVGGGLIAKTLYDRTNARSARRKGAAELQVMAEDGKPG
ncbi:hypothetical protein [Novosphingobium colocasiae]|uniref:Uncharacterized protein n=1 Tax=Novosphingobium colocasiae TaxID=1256513 RepID=A0A918UH56_9SPHN|nr:hypothetical protein [Novosphingobium colocasiae]GGZ07374.1 hypothetical protein GCM10011614_22880 [Novosphingobium colocasiae]